MPPPFSFEIRRNPIICFFKPPGGGDVNYELDINKITYLHSGVAGNSRQPTVSKEIISRFILMPQNSSYPLRNLKMKTCDVDSVVQPAHLPSIRDCHPLPTSLQNAIKWYLQNYHAIPPHLLKLLDPKPQPNFGTPSFKLMYEKLYLCMATYSDALQVVDAPLHYSVIGLKVSHHGNNFPYYRAPFHTVIMDPLVCQPFQSGYTPLSPQTRIACWNVRGITRPSFVANFNILCEVHNPTVVVLLEIRHAGENVAAMINQVRGRYHHLATPVNSFDGGVAILWVPGAVMIEHRPTIFPDSVLNVFMQGLQALEAQIFPTKSDSLPWINFLYFLFQIWSMYGL